MGVPCPPVLGPQRNAQAKVGGCGQAREPVGARVMKVKSESEVAQSCPTLSDPMDWSLPGSSIHGIFQARVLEWGVSFTDSGLSQVTSYG